MTPQEARAAFNAGKLLACWNFDDAGDWSADYDTLAGDWELRFSPVDGMLGSSTHFSTADEMVMEIQRIVGLEGWTAIDHLPLPMGNEKRRMKRRGNWL